jgi:YesN/AraC family two-component response regulator
MALSSVSTLLAGKRIVTIEDEGIIQMQLRKILPVAGLLLVGQAMSGEEGLELIFREKPDLVLMDISLPGMDGIEATRRVMDQSPTLVVIISALPAAHYEQRTKEAGACGYIEKPITADILIAELEQCYKQHGPK